MSAQLSLVLPVYNEGENITEALEEISKQVGQDYEICLVYDFEEDSTLVPARKAQTRLGLPIRYLRNKYGRGVLNAMKTGFEETTAEYVVVTMADLSDPPSVINAMMQKAREGSDIVCASRYMSGGRQIGGPLIKRTLSRLAGVSLYHLIRIPTHDITNNFKLYRRRVLDAIVIESKGGFELGMELVIKGHFQGYKISEVATCWRDRTAGQSRFRLMKWLPRYLYWYWYALYRKCR